MKYLLGLKKLPFEQDEKQIIYVENEYNEEINRYIQTNYERISRKFDSWGYKFCYIPYLGNELAVSDSMYYYAPFASADFKPSLKLSSSFLLDWMVNPQNRGNIKPSLLYYHPKCFQSDFIGAESQFCAITLLDSNYNASDDFSNLLREIHDDLCNYDSKRIRFHFVPREDVEKFKSSLTEEERKEMELWNSISEKYRRRGVERYLLATMAYGEEDELSPLRVTKDYRIILTKSGKEVKMGYLPKTLYLFYLRRDKDIPFITWLCMLRNFKRFI